MSSNGEIMRKFERLSKIISHSLRHEPWLYQLELDDQGWVSIENLILALRRDSTDWTDVSEQDLLQLINSSTKKRHEIKDGRIRALYGHSTAFKISKISIEPPDLLYHGTSPEIVEIIMSEGLKPMCRHFVHLSVCIETAIQVGSRKSRTPIILIIDAKSAYKDDIKFYQGNEQIWLADYVPRDYISQNDL